LPPSFYKKELNVNLFSFALYSDVMSHAPQYSSTSRQPQREFVSGAQQLTSDRLQQLQQENTRLQQQLEIYRLSATNDPFVCMFHQSPHLMAMLSLDGLVIEANQSLLNYVGLNAAEVLQRPVWQLPCWAGLSDTIDGLQRAIDGAALGKPTHHEIQIYQSSHAREQRVSSKSLSNLSQAPTSIDLFLMPLQEQNGGVRCLLLEGRDVTDRKQVQLELQQRNVKLEQRIAERTAQFKASDREKERALLNEKKAQQQAELATGQIQLYANIFEHLPVGLTVWHLVEPDDPTSLRLIVSNPAASQLTGVPLHHRIGQTIDACFPNILTKYRTDLNLYASIALSGQTVTNREVHYDQPSVGEVVFHTKIFSLPDRCVGIAFEDITDRKHEKQALQDSERRYAALAQVSPIGIFRCDTAGYCVYVNDRWCQIAGIPPDAAFGEGWIRSLHPDDRTRVVEEWARARRENRAFRLEYRFQRPDGSVTWVVGQAAAETLIQGRVSGYVGGITDITDLKHAEAALLESEHRYSTLAQMCPVGIFRTDMAGNCLYVNQRWSEITGIRLGEALGEGWEAALHPDDRDRVQIAGRKAAAEGTPFRSEFRFQRPDGTVRWVFGQAILETGVYGEPIGFVGTVTDITDRKLAEVALQESEERFRATFDQAAVGIANVSLDGRWLRVNDRLCETVGYSREEMLQMTFQTLTHPDDLEENLAHVQQLLAGNIQTYSMEKRYIRKDGSPIWINLTVSLMREMTLAEDGSTQASTPKYMISVVEDINARKQTELALQERAQELSQLNTILTRTTALLEERNRELDRFAYVASHDLKAPLRAIANLSEWIEEDLEGQLPEENQQQLSLLRTRVHRMESLINGLLEYSRAGRTQTAIDTISVRSLLEEVIDSLDPPAAFTITIQPNMPTLTTRSLLLRQVFANLIGNAIKHHDRPDGNIQISVNDKGWFYEFAVSDDGAGISPEHHDRVFSIFQTLVARDVKESTGIGLSIVKKIVETEGGRIKLESDVGQGATFRFTWLKQLKPVAGTSASL
jgi:PAS domain S-box-containing protein